MLLLGASLRLGRPREALSEARESLRLSKGPDVETQFLIASSLNELGRAGEAELQLNDVLKAQPDYPEALLLQGLVKLELVKLDEAEALLKRAIEKDPQSQWGRLGLGVLRRLRAQNAQSRAELEKLVKDKPDWSLAQFELGRTLLSLGDVDAALKRYPLTAADAVVIATRGHRNDALILEQVAISPAGYVGLLGSRRKKAVVTKGLKAAGVPGKSLQRVRVPVGLPIGAVTPEEIAVSVVAELIGWRRRES